MMLKDSNKDVYRWCGEAVATHGNQTFYKSFVVRNREYKLGDVVYVRHMDDYERMSFLEVLMMWELRGEMYLSLRAYYFPEDTEEGRFPEQGQDEVLCMEGEVVMHCREFLQHLDSTHSESRDLPELKILSFPSYCRCCAVRRRLGDLLSHYTSHPMFAALGGVDPRFRVLFCRETVRDKELQRLWKCRNLYRDVPDKTYPSKKKKLMIHSESNDDSSISDTGEIMLYKSNGRAGKRKRSNAPAYTNKPAGTKATCDGKTDPNKISSCKGNEEEDTIVEVEDISCHTVTSSAVTPSDNSEVCDRTRLLNNVASIKIPTDFLSCETTPQELDMIVKHLSEEMSGVTKTNFVTQNTAPKPSELEDSGLVRNVANIKLPTYLFTSTTTPQQLDVLVRHLSQLQDAQNTKRKLKYLMKQ